MTGSRTLRAAPHPGRVPLKTRTTRSVRCAGPSTRFATYLTSRIGGGSAGNSTRVRTCTRCAARWPTPTRARCAGATTSSKPEQMWCLALATHAIRVLDGGTDKDHINAGRPIKDPLQGLACADGAAEEGDESVDGGCIVGDRLGWVESAGARLCGELDLHEGQ